MKRYKCYFACFNEDGAECVSSRVVEANDEKEAWEMTADNLDRCGEDWCMEPEDVVEIERPLSTMEMEQLYQLMVDCGISSDEDRFLDALIPLNQVNRDNFFMYAKGRLAEDDEQGLL